MLPPKIKFKGFFYYLNQLKSAMDIKRVFVYTWSDYNFNYFKKILLVKLVYINQIYPGLFIKEII